MPKPSRRRPRRIPLRKPRSRRWLRPRAATIGGALMTVLGESAEPLVSSGDDVADANARTRFVDQYDEAHELVADGENKFSLEVGDDDWPFPFPIVKVGDQWAFDVDAGIDEVVYRRIGHNELGAMEACRGIVDAQKEYASEGHDGLPAGILRAEADERRRQAQRPLLAFAARRTRKPRWTIHCHGRRGRLSKRCEGRSAAVPRLCLSSADCTGRCCTRRCTQLPEGRTADRRISRWLRIRSSTNRAACKRS